MMFPYGKNVFFLKKHCIIVITASEMTIILVTEVKRDIGTAHVKNYYSIAKSDLKYQYC